MFPSFDIWCSLFAKPPFHLPKSLTNFYPSFKTPSVPASDCVVLSMRIASTIITVFPLISTHFQVIYLLITLICECLISNFPSLNCEFLEDRDIIFTCVSPVHNINNKCGNYCVSKKKREKEWGRMGVRRKVNEKRKKARANGVREEKRKRKRGRSKELFCFRIHFTY